MIPEISGLGENPRFEETTVRLSSPSLDIAARCRGRSRAGGRVRVLATGVCATISSFPGAHAALRPAGESRRVAGCERGPRPSAGCLTSTWGRRRLDEHEEIVAQHGGCKGTRSSTSCAGSSAATSRPRCPGSVKRAAPSFSSTSRVSRDRDLRDHAMPGRNRKIAPHARARELAQLLSQYAT